MPGRRPKAWGAAGKEEGLAVQIAGDEGPFRGGAEGGDLQR